MYQSMSLTDFKAHQANITYYADKQGHYQSPAFDSIKIKQTTMGPLKIYFYADGKVVAVRTLNTTDTAKLERTKR